MPDPVHSHHIAIDDDDELITRGAHDTRGPGSLSVSVIRKLADLLDLDPTSTSLQLDNYIDLDWLDQLPDRDVDHDENNIGVVFHYGDYKLFVCSCGKISIYGDLEAHKRGELETPASMREATPDPTEVSVPEHSRTPRPSRGRKLP